MRRPVAERTVWPLRVVLDPPGFDDAAGVSETDEPVLVQTLVTKFPVEAFDVRILVRLAGPDERQMDIGLIGLAVEHLSCELRAVIHSDGSRQSPRLSKSLHHCLEPCTGQRRIDLDRHAFPSAVVHDVQASDPSAIGQAVGDEFHRPALVRRHWFGQRLGFHLAPASACFKTAMICSSVILVAFIGLLLVSRL